MENIVEKNRIIAEFDGWGIDNSFPDKDRTYYKNGCIELDSTFKYHTSWDWLMPVVEKIEKLGLGYFKYNYTWSYYNSNGNCLWYKNNNEKGIINLFFEVVEFIKWYNENK